MPITVDKTWMSFGRRRCCRRRQLFRRSGSITLTLFVIVPAFVFWYHALFPVPEVNQITDHVDFMHHRDKFSQRPESACDESNLHPMSDTCNCLTTTVMDGWGGTCCSRTLRHAHKMGNHLAREALPWEVWSNLRIATDTFRNSKPIHDYRDVVIVRDFYDTIVSGYLYHKKGHECWLDAFGQPSNVSTIDTQWWETIRTVMPFPIRRKRSLCQYLVDESDEHGLHLYLHMSFNYWFKHMAAQHAYVQSLGDDNRTMFLCFVELASPITREASVLTIVAHLYPGIHNFRLAAAIATNATYRYVGAHSTKDVADDYKVRLRETVAQLDEKYYKGDVANINALFSCKPD
ncbi:hypothetical protein MPSEU_000297400 [Mayamaea pseudoterrestris]|nr:hypothetical protein MPSEU_000297400 [Mayamaea pseudoterrestris]